MDISPVDTPCQCQSLLPKMQMILAFWGLFAKWQQRRFGFDNSDFKSGIFCCLVSADFAIVAVVAVAWGPHEGHGPTVGSHRRQKTQWDGRKTCNIVTETWCWQAVAQHCSKQLFLLTNTMSQGAPSAVFCAKLGLKLGIDPSFGPILAVCLGARMGWQWVISSFFWDELGWCQRPTNNNKSEKKSTIKLAILCGAPPSQTLQDQLPHGTKPIINIVDDAIRVLESVFSSLTPSENIATKLYRLYFYFCIDQFTNLPIAQTSMHAQNKHHFHVTFSAWVTVTSLILSV